MTKRIKALDAFRGLTIALMILVNTPGTWNHVFLPLRHAEWDGWTPTDLVFPFFLFIVGVSLYFSFKRFHHNLNARSAEKILKRTAAIFLIGLLLNAFPWHLGYHNVAWKIGFYLTLIAWLSMPWWKDKVKPGLLKNLEWLCLALLIGLFLFTLNGNTLRVFGVLQRIALAFGFGAFACLLFKGRSLLIVLATLLIGYYLVMIGFGDLTLVGNFQRAVDIAILGEAHVYQGYADAAGKTVPFDPEGILSTIPSIGNVIIGFLVGQLIDQNKDKKEVVSKLFIYGFPMMVVAYLWNPFFPINKPIWSSSYVLLTCGLGMILLGCLIYIMDIKKYESWAKPFVVFGLNPLFIYALSSISVKILFWIKTLDENGEAVSGYRSLYDNLFVSWMGNNEFASLAFAVFYVFLHWIVAYMMYDRKVFIKV